MECVVRYVVCLLCLCGSIGNLYATKRKLTLDQVVYSSDFVAHTPILMRSAADGVTYTTLTGEGIIVRWGYAQGRVVDTVFTRKAWPELERVGAMSGYRFSEDESMLLLEFEREKIYRYSYKARYWVYDIKKRSLHPLTERGSVRQVNIAPRGDKVSFVHGNDLYWVDWRTGAEHRVTTDGRVNHIINGACDWVYEEEFVLTECTAWSDDGRYLCYMRFDESAVEEYAFPVYGPERLYPGEYRYKYPKAGEKNSEVTLHVHDVMQNQSRAIDVGYEKGFTDYYIPRIDWVKGVGLKILTLDRLQREVRMLLYNPAHGSCKEVYREREEKYISELPSWYGYFLPDGKRFIVQSERDGWMHLYLCHVEGGTPVQLTHGKEEVQDFYGVDARGERLYYRALEGDPMHTALYSVDLKGKKRRKLSSKRGTNEGIFNSTCSYFALWHTSTTEPLTVTLCEAQRGKTVRVLEDNAALRSTLREYALPRKEFFSFRTPDGDTLYGYKVLPVDFDSTKRYPVLLYQYSGPNSQQVFDYFSVGWSDYLAQEGCLVVCVDGRGTGGRGEAFRKCTYGKLGDLESRDQIAVGEWLQKQPYVAGDRIGIWGWSYGGYMASLCLMRAPEVFCMAIAVAPVTSWRLYDTIYTERYMGLPQDNAQGYDEYTPLHFASALRGKLYLIHGQGDDNVHIQHSMWLVERLVAAGKPFRMSVYPDRNHGIYGGGARSHLFHSMQEFAKVTLSL